MPPRLEALEITAFRGATTTTKIEFDGSPVCVLFGENGCGKSTIVDAIDFVCNGKLGSLESRRLGPGKRKEPYITAIGRNEADVSVSIRFGGTTWSAKHSRQGVKRCSEPNRPQAWILRRSDLLEFVEAEPSVRYQKLASSIAIADIENSEEALRQAVSEIERAVQAAEQSRNQANDALVEFWKAEGEQGQDCLSWAKEEAGKATTEMKSQVVLADEIINAIDDAQVRKQQLAADSAAVVAADQVHQQSAIQWDEAAATMIAGVGPLVEVLVRARDFFVQDAQASVCPVCEQAITANALVERLNERLIQLQAAVQAKGRLDRAVVVKVGADERLTAATKSWSVAAGELWSKLDNGKSAGGELDSAVGGALARVGPVDVELTSIQCQVLAEELEALRSSVEAIRVATQKTIHQHTTISQHVRTIESKTVDLIRLSDLWVRGKEAVSIFQVARKEFVEGVLREVSADVGDLYARVHPGEPIGGLQLYLDPVQRASLKFEGSFQSSPAVPPQAYFSESHLDTLGVCVFLALVKRYLRQPSILVLDDVFTSVDQAHLDRLSRLVHDQSSHLAPILVTTHYRPWRELYRYGRAPGRQAQLVDLLRWTVDRGIRHTRTPLVLDDLRHELAKEPLDRQALASQAGILAESLLDHLTLTYQCGLPRRPAGDFALGDLLNGVNGKLLKALKITRRVGSPPIEHTFEVKPLLDAVASMTWIRNQVGCHFNLGGMDVADTQVVEFAQAVLALGDTLVCPSCGELPRSAKSGVGRKCRCDVTRLVPLEAPS